MLSSTARFIFSLAALSPVALTWAIADFGQRGWQLSQGIIFFCALLLALICGLVLLDARRRLTRISFAVVEVKAVDNEVVAYVVAYLFPLVTPAPLLHSYSLIFIFALLAVVMSSSHAFTFNPLLTLMGYHFYEVKCSSGVSYLVLSKRDVTDVKLIRSVGRLSNFLMLDLAD
jgi:hypothetical protein